MLRRTVSLSGSKKIAPAAFHAALKRRGCEAYYGVPDSLLKDLCAYITANVSDPTKHVITANEGNAIAMATGYHLASRNIPAVYMQNSGFGNTVNPLLSLTHREVYRIPMLLLIGWRGDPTGKPDEPQHVAQGRLMEENLKSCEVPYSILSPGEGIETQLESALETAFSYMKSEGTPYGLLIKRDVFEEYKLPTNAGAAAGDSAQGVGVRGDGRLDLALSREKALELIVSSMTADDIVVSTTGMPSREVFEIRARAKAGHHRDFLTVGCMGHCSSIAAGIALTKPDRTVYCIDGDGASLMHLGSYAVNGGLGAIRNVSQSSDLLENLRHIVVNNGAHDSVGGQPTVGFDVSLSDVAQACGYNVISKPVVDVQGLVDAMEALKNCPKGMGPSFLEVLVKKGNRKDLGRPTTTPQENKKAFMDFVAK
jgi:phosphonopyruvate decarboxylase